jgi:broad specificity phosphatase PhoE
MPTAGRGRRLTLLRHTANAGDRLTDAGIEAAVALGAELAGTGFTLVVTSGAQRAAQTAACVLASGLLTVPLGVYVHEGFALADGAAWDEAINDAGGPEIMGIKAAAPALVGAAAAALSDAVTWTCDRLSKDGHALIVSHSPLIELAVWELTGTAPDPFERGQWVTVDGPSDR